MRTVRLYGELGKRFGRAHRLDVSTPAEAIRALSVNHPGLRQHLIEAHERGVAYRCLVDDEEAGADRLTGPMSREFSITPVVHGAGKLGAILQVVAGIALVAFAAPIAGALGISAITASTVGFMGVGLALAGVSTFLTPTPKLQNKGGKTETNDYFDGPVNSVAQGAPVPFGYGRVIVGSAVISAGITVEQQTAGVAAIGGFSAGWN